MRDVTIKTVLARDDIGPGWDEIIGDRYLDRLVAGEFAMAEEVIGFLQFRTEPATYEVGVGQAMRPYRCLYVGSDFTDALNMFWKAVATHAGV